ncbi:hypothetical protein [Butyrivibrio sp. AE3006]|uniref:hypothetical protein n=1 Tax=Butyrivibrio sp. AE3006 TaxID=1280673 RepID=UPI0003F740D8|nr:hypothetical protein [Butyrivibrio sp. AE3006]
MNEKEDNSIYSDTAYDDAFRTMESECDDLIIPFINHMFGEHYDKTAVIHRLRNEHFVEHEDGSSDRRITDSHFEIIASSIKKKYHLECESKKYDGTILVRIFEYDAQIAKDEGKSDMERFRVRFPNTGLLLLRRSSKAPSDAIIEIELPDGNVKSYPIPIMQVADYTIDEIFDKKLYMLIPFYIFNYEKQLEIINEDEAKIEKLMAFYREMFDKLLSEVDSGNLSPLSCSAIIKLTYRVAYKLTKKRQNVQRKVGDVMGGKVLDLPEFRIYHQGLEQGIKIYIKDKIDDKVPEEKIIEKLIYNFDISPEKAKEYYERFAK